MARQRTPRRDADMLRRLARAIQDLQGGGPVIVSTTEPAPWTDDWFDDLTDDQLRELQSLYAEMERAGHPVPWQLRKVKEEIYARDFIARLYARMESRQRGGANARAH